MIQVFCPRCRSLVRIGAELDPEVRREAIRGGADSTLGGIQVLHRRAGWELREGKGFVHHLPPDGHCRRCGSAVRGLSLCANCRSLNVDPTSGWLRPGDALLKISGWEPGLRKVATTDALRTLIGISLKSAKSLTELILQLPDPFCIGPLEESAARDAAETLADLGLRVTVVLDPPNPTVSP